MLIPGVQLVVISTHLDDAVLSCYSVLSAESIVVTMMAGIPPAGFVTGWDYNAQEIDSRDVVIARRKEDETACAIANTRHVHLDFLDSQYYEPARVDAPASDDLIDGLRPYVEGAVVYAPAGIYNADHQTVRDAVLALRPDATLYADIPYALRADMGGFNLPPEGGIPFGLRGSREVELEPVAAAAKVESVRCYATQLPRLLSIFGLFVNVESLGREVFWQSRAPSP